MSKWLRWSALSLAPAAITFAACDSGSSNKQAGPEQQGAADPAIIVAVMTQPCGESLTTTRVSLVDWSAAHDRLLSAATAFVDSIKTAENHASASAVSGTLRLASYRRQTPTPRPTPAPQTLATDAASHNIIRDTSHKLSPGLSTTLLHTQQISNPKITQQQACAGASTPEVQDAQHLIDKGAFGPLAQIVTMPGVNLKTYADYGDFRLAALIEVTRDAGMTDDQYHNLSSYKALRLELAINCLFLRRTGVAWEARMTRQNAANVCDQSDAKNGAKLDVSSSPPNSASPSPPNSRFIEANDMSPMIGVRCAMEWCVIGPPGVVPAKPSHLHPSAPGLLEPMSMPHAPPTSPQTKLGLWSDEQHLAVFAAPGAKGVPGFLASAIPDTGLTHRTLDDYGSRWILGAYVYSPSEPPASYAQKFGYTKGWNRVYLRRDGDIWMALVLDAAYGIHIRPVTNYPHTIGDAVGTVRFAWVDGDEWVWVPCGDGCCLVENGSDS